MAQQFSRWDRTGITTIDFTTPESLLNLFYRPSAPNPPEYNTPEDILIPVDIAPHFEEPVEDELNCLVMNITTPRLGSDSGAKLPVMVYIHGGSFLFGGPNKGVFDCVNLTTFAAARNTPVVTVNLNYRVGLGGFLASAAIKEDIERDGLEGVGNFGLYDQQVALHWVNRYIASFGRDPDNVTIYGESAGGISVSHHTVAKDPAPFHRAIAMSGHLNTIQTWPLEHHEMHYRALLRYIGIDADSPSALDQLRNVPEAVVAAATIPVEGLLNATGNPFDDGVFHKTKPAANSITSPPAWLKSYIVGDTNDEVMIFTDDLAEETFDSWRTGMKKFLSEKATDGILGLYGVTPDLSKEELLKALEDMTGDSAFKIHNWIAVHRSNIPQTIGYHLDQVCTHDSIFKGQAYHALDLLYVFLNFGERLTPGQQKPARTMVGSFIDYSYGRDPWPRFADGGRWMRFGPDETSKVVTEAEDENVRRYTRMQKILEMGVLEEFMTAIDNIAIKRDKMGTFEGGPRQLSEDIKAEPAVAGAVGIKEAVLV